jgi:hypothetical protein
MKLCRLSLETAFFEDFLFFLVEVLELELLELTDLSMKLDLFGTGLEINKVSVAPHQGAFEIEFDLDFEELQSLKQKMFFFSFRRGSSRFLTQGLNHECSRIADPDGRVWSFKQRPAQSCTSVESPPLVRNC